MLLPLLFVLAGPVQAQNADQPKEITDTDETAFGSITGPSQADDEVLSQRSYEMIDIINTTDCDIEIEFDGRTGDPSTVVPAGTSETIDFGSAGGYLGTSANLNYMLGETCSSGSVYVKGIY
jgi:hypothetical protein